MANERISDLPNLGDVASDDEIAIVDVSAGATKKATIADAVGDYGNTVYPRLSSNNTMTGDNTFEQPLTIESTDANMLRLQNTAWGGAYARFGQQDDGEGALQLPSGLLYVFSESGNEGGNTVLRRSYADSLYARLANANTFTAANTFTSSSPSFQIRCQHTSYGGEPNKIGQTSDGAFRISSGGGFVYDFDDEGSEDAFSVVRRKYGDARYAQLDATNIFGEQCRFDNGIRMNFGTEASPSYAFNGDVNSGFYRIANDDLGLSLNANLRYRFNNSLSNNECVLTRSLGDGRYTLSSSDESKKENIEDLQGSGDIIDGLMPRNFTWIPNEDDPKPEGLMTGLIAQEVEQVLPAAVLGSDGNKGLDALSLIGVVVAELKSLRARVAELEGEQ